jgi:NAD(P)-dependent dehydrogenase (short-subunit alcohol dehydrogenase family)
MSRRIDGKVALVFGAGAVGPGWGNGKASAVLYAREGAKVFAVDVDLAAAVATRAIIEAEGGICVAHCADVSRAEEIEGAVAGCIATFGAVDIVHNNVGIVEVGGPIEITSESWDRTFAINVKSMFLAAKFAIPSMLQQWHGAFVNISSLRRFAIRDSPRPLTWHRRPQVIGLTQNIALQYAAQGIRANCILPGIDEHANDRQAADGGLRRRSREHASSPRRAIADRGAWATAGTSRMPRSSWPPTKRNT